VIIDELIDVSVCVAKDFGEVTFAKGETMRIAERNGEWWRGIFGECRPVCNCWRPGCCALARVSLTRWLALCFYCYSMYYYAFDVVNCSIDDVAKRSSERRLFDVEFFFFWPRRRDLTLFWCCGLVADGRNGWFPGARVT
jgi:hypothetical protein